MSSVGHGKRKFFFMNKNLNIKPNILKSTPAPPQARIFSIMNFRLWQSSFEGKCKIMIVWWQTTNAAAGLFTHLKTVYVYQANCVWMFVHIRIPPPLSAEPNNITTESEVNCKWVASINFHAEFVYTSHPTSTISPPKNVSTKINAFWFNKLPVWALAFDSFVYIFDIDPMPMCLWAY